MNFFKIIIELFIDMSIYIMFGLIIVGILHEFVKKTWIIKQLGKNNLASVVKAAIIGVPLPLCSCSVVPTAVEIKKEGASNGAAMSFLISTPQTGIDNMIATWGMIGPFLAIFRTITAFITGIIGGIVTNILVKEDKENKEENKEVKTCCHCNKQKVEENVNLITRIIRAIKYAFGTFLDDIAIHFLIGIIISGIISVIIPENFFLNYGLNNTLITMILMILVGIPMYICSTASIPVAMSLILKGLSPGSAFVFLVTGPITNIASLTVLTKVFGKKVMSIYIATVSVLAIVFGLIFDYMIKILNIDILSNISYHAHTESNILSNIIAVIFLGLLIKSIIVKIMSKK